jgi:hypothetical protein
MVLRYMHRFSDWSSIKDAKKVPSMGDAGCIEDRQDAVATPRHPAIEGHIEVG